MRIYGSTVLALATTLLLSPACGDDSGDGTSAPDAATGADSATSPDAAVGNPDLDTFAAILAGEIDPAEGLISIAHSAGWPIQDGDAYIFARLDDGSGAHSLAGSFDNWADHPLTDQSGVQWIQLDIAQPDGALYKFVDGGQAFAADPLARRYGYDENGQYSLVRATATHLERWPAIGNTTTSPRTIRVRVPATAATHHLYVHDGQNIFDPGAIFGGWKLGDTIGDSTLAIAIDNTAARFDEYTHVTDDFDGPGGNPVVGGGGDEYADYIADVVVPLVEREYGAPVTRGVLGSSLGGLISLHIGMRHPDLFAFVGSMSGTLGWGSIGLDNETIIHRFRAAAIMPYVIYLDSGGNDGGGCIDADADTINDDSNDTDNYCTNRQLADELAAAGYVFDQNLYHWYEPDAPHNEAAWSARVFRPIDIFEAL